MTDVHYDNAIAGAAPAAAAQPERKGYWKRVFDAMVEARMRQAERMLRDYQDLTKR